LILTLRGAASRCTAFETQVARQLIPPLFGKSFDACAARRKLVDHSLFAAGPAVGFAPLTLHEQSGRSIIPETR
jgi:hypothetical protein